MSEHYYTRKPTSTSEKHAIAATLRGRPFSFITDTGVFSKREVDFGSRLLIESMHLPRGARVLDVGCGYGPIGLVAAAVCPDAHVTMVDINERAVHIAQVNADRLGLGNVRIMQSDAYEALGPEMFDVIVTNPPIRAGKSVIYRIFDEAPGRLHPGGSLWVVIQKKQGAPSALARLQETFGQAQVRQEAKEKGYYVFRAATPPASPLASPPS